MKDWPVRVSAFALVMAIAVPASAEGVRVLVPDQDNLQYLAFWVAKGAGYLEDEGLTVTLSIPSAPSQTVDYVKRADSDVAILPPPMYLELIAAREPIVLVANLLQNDPIDLVVRKSVMDQRGITREQPVAERLQRLAGLRIGVAPNPPQRMRALFAAFGMDADRDVHMVILRGPEQNYAFEKDEVDGLYAHTPYLETALVDEGAEMVIDQSGGEVPGLATRQIHALVAMRSYAENHPSTVRAMTRAIARAERLVHGDEAATVAAVLKLFPSMDPKKVARIVRIYAPAVPVTPRVSVEGIRPALALFPATKKAPDLDGIDLSAYVDPRFAEEAGSTHTWNAWLVGIAGAIVLLVAVGAWVMRRRQARRTAG